MTEQAKELIGQYIKSSNNMQAHISDFIQIEETINDLTDIQKALFRQILENIEDNKSKFNHILI